MRGSPTLSPGLAVDAQHQLVAHACAVSLLDGDRGVGGVLIEVDFDVLLPVREVVAVQLGLPQTEDSGAHQVPPALAAQRAG